jgi:hypothetical protein
MYNTNIGYYRVRSSDSVALETAGLFRKQLRNPTAKRGLFKWLSKSSQPILVLKNFKDGHSVGNKHFIGVCTIAVKSIHGTIERDGDFDYNFFPLRRSDEFRWRNVASAMLRGIDLPPIEVIKIGEHFFVNDGHHRISVARALGITYIDALVEVWQ